MYHGNNEKALASQHAISAGLLTLLEELPYSDISITALCRTAEVSRPTFYSLFTGKDDVVSFILLDGYNYSPQPASNSCLRSFCRSFSHYITENRRILILFVENGISHLLFRHFFDSLICCDHFLAEVESSTRCSAASFIAGALTGLISDYIMHDSYAEDELCLLMESFFGGNLFTPSR